MSANKNDSSHEDSPNIESYESPLEEEESLFNETDSSEVPPPDIVAFTELRSAADLVRMHDEGQLQISPDFQREIVWSDAKQTRFIDSLIKQLPIPSMCLSLDYKEQAWNVIDGLQRISTIIRFLTDDNWCLSNIKDIDQRLAGQRTSAFKEEGTDLIKLRKVVQNTTLPINVLRCDFTKPTHRDYIFEVFHRLNTGGSSLSNQEIRNCIYNGTLNNLLHMLNKDSHWLQASRFKEATGHRYRGQEVILRLLAFNDSYQDYDGKLAKFLNNYMHENQNPDESWLSEREDLFRKIISKIDETIGAETRTLSLTIFEAFVVGCMRNEETFIDRDKDSVKRCLDTLLKQSDFSSENLREGISSKDKVIARMETAESVLKDE